jgi:CheY-like chemotaxis protein
MPLVLAVDDDAMSRALLEAVLNRAGYRVALAGRADEALAAATQAAPSAVVCDVHLNDGDGFAITQALRSVPEMRDMPIILLTGYATADDVEAAQAAGADALLPKARNRDVLLATLAALLNRNAARPAFRTE